MEVVFAIRVTLQAGVGLSAEDITPQVRQFIADFIPSLARLEILLFLKTHAQQVWTAEGISRELRLDQRATADQLATLGRDGFLEHPQPGQFRYAPRTPELDAQVGALAQAYHERRVTVISLIFASPPDVLQWFSDSFRLRKDRPNG